MRPCRRWCYCNKHLCWSLRFLAVETHRTTKHQTQDAGFQPAGVTGPKEKQLAPMELLLRVFKDEKPPKHPELGHPCMQLSTLRAAIRARLDGRRWDKVGGERGEKSEGKNTRGTGSSGYRHGSGWKKGRSMKADRRRTLFFCFNRYLPETVRHAGTWVSTCLCNDLAWRCRKG